MQNISYHDCVSPRLLVTVVGVVGEHLEHEVPVLGQGGEVDAEVVLEPLAEQQRLVLDRIWWSRDSSPPITAHLGVALPVHLGHRDVGLPRRRVRELTLRVQVLLSIAEILFVFFNFDIVLQQYSSFSEVLSKAEEN